MRPMVYREMKTDLIPMCKKPSKYFITICTQHVRIDIPKKVYFNIDKLLGIISNVMIGRDL